jgi:soluble lytic murein transglycosylase-like protein
MDVRQRLGKRAASERRVRCNDWRIICPCQHHQKSAGAKAARALPVWKRRVGTFLVGLPLAFGAVILPANETTRVVPPVRERRAAPQMARFTILTQKIRDGYLFDDFSSQQFAIERRKQDFFRTEVPYGDLIYVEAKRNNLDPELIAAVVKAESDFRPHLCSNRNAEGLMQIIPSTGQLMGARNLYDPAQNVRAGARYLRYLFDRYSGDQRLVLAAYNAGEGNIARFGGMPPFRETLDYVDRVRRERESYRSRIDRRVATLREEERVARFAE